MVVTATLLVTFGRISDMFGEFASIISALRYLRWAAHCWRFTPGTGNTGAIELIIFRFIQGIGGGFLFSNSAAILTDAFPVEPARASARHKPDRGHRRLSLSG